MPTFLVHGLWLIPFAMAAGVARVESPAIARRAALLAVAALLVATCVVSFAPSAILWSVSSEQPASSPIDGIGAVLLPLTVALTLSVLVAAPRAELGRHTLQGVLVVLGSTLGALITTNVLALALFWTTSLLPLRSGVVRDPPLSRALNRAFWGATLPAGLALLALVAAGWRAGIAAPWEMKNLARAAAAAPSSWFLGGLVLLSAMFRVGVLPFHSWVPATVQRAPLSLTIPTLVSPLGCYMLTRVGLAVFPGVFDAASHVLVPVGVVSTVYGALLGLGQDDLRRQVGFFLVSTMGLVIVGLFALDVRTMSGALLHEVGALLSVLGLLLVVSGDRGAHRHGGHAPTRWPGSGRPWHGDDVFPVHGRGGRVPGDGGVRFGRPLDAGAHPRASDHDVGPFGSDGPEWHHADSHVQAGVFLGAPSRNTVDTRRFDDVLPRERWTFAVLVVVLLAGGLVPAPALAIRKGVVMALEGARTQ